MQWNSHPLSTEGNRSPTQLWIHGMQMRATSGSTVTDELYGLTDEEFQAFGLEPSLELPDGQWDSSSYDRISVPQTVTGDDERQLDILRDSLDPLAEDRDGYGSSVYVRAKAILGRLN